MIGCLYYAVSSYTLACVECIVQGYKGTKLLVRYERAILGMRGSRANIDPRHLTESECQAVNLCKPPVLKQTYI